MDSLRGRFSQNLRARRIAHGYSQAEVAELCGLASEAYGRLERGLVLPRVQTLIRLASVFGVSTDELLGLGTESPDSRGEEKSLPLEIQRLVGEAKRLPPDSLQHLVAFLRTLRAS